jgi:DNA-binding LacI/PurR family transcriptional regulator
MKQRAAKTVLNMRAVAQRAGVSSATISRVINGSSAVKQETAERVRRILKELNYIPNPIATTLKYGRSNTFGLIVPDLINPFFPEFLLAFEQVLVENDHELLLATTQSTETKLLNSVRRMLMRQVDGVVLMGSEYETRAVEPLFERKIPIVTLDRRRVQAGTGDVAFDFEGGYLQAVEHLHGLGHRRIGFLGGTKGIRTSEIRLESFRKAIQNLGLTYYPELVREGDYRVDGGEAAMKSLLETARRPTAVLTANDLTAFGALRALRDRGISVPEQMSVIGFDGIKLGSAVSPSLTTVRIPTREAALACIQVLRRLRANIERRGMSVSVKVEFLIRRSTARAPRNR